MPQIGDIVTIKSVIEICNIHNVSDIAQLMNFGPGWDDCYMNRLCGKSYEIIGYRPLSAEGDWFAIKDEDGIEWWLLQEWFDSEEITKPMRAARVNKCRHHDQPSGITIDNVMLLDNEPFDVWSKSTEDNLISKALENAGRQLKYRLRSWPVCGNGGKVELWGYLDRDAKTVTAHWCCSCQDG